MVHIIDGNAVATLIREDLKTQIDTLQNSGVTPGLATVLMSDDPASKTYVSMKQRDCEELGMNATDIVLDPTSSSEELFSVLNKLNSDSDVHGYLVQMPLPSHIPEQELLFHLDPMKDVDGFHPENVGLLVSGNPRYKPCTPHGIQKLLESIDVDTSGKDIVVVGRSNIVGKPLANLLLQKSSGGNATVTICHSRTRDLANKTREADIIIAALGVPEFITGSMVSDGVIVIDVGVNRVDDDSEKGYHLAGDVEFDSVSKKAKAITPVPGGVGPMTRAMLMYNTVQAASLQSNISL
ncbi:tetrahydrofolate dehydrogenase/cyclohydrolase catalytic domain-containing protein [Candidatus Hikarchaeum yamanae]|uniref:tetrahydrofolate dehydrogenase/cyclohydrolase catalytic domain-containing protein n=1 Tax=Candidatus Hikarchaeum yamanae TaxID=2675326 RepID=UPI0039ED5564|tara:strand:+ start:4882 stop:5766 length:885 start_codon:yes stop_codon:yes gene_type:complete